MREKINRLLPVRSVFVGQERALIDQIPRWRSDARFLAMLISSQAHAIEVRMTCEKKDAKYVVAFDTETNIFMTTNSALNKNIKVHKVQNDEDGVLVWTSTAVFGGDRDILAFFGREK